MRDRLVIPDDWKAADIGSLPDAIADLARQWPDGAYAAEAEAFHQHWRGKGRRNADWDALWVSRVQNRHESVMRAAGAGISFGRPVAAVADQASEPQAPSAAKEREDQVSADLHDELRAALGEALWRQWFEPCALLMEDDCLQVIAPPSSRLIGCETGSSRPSERRPQRLAAMSSTSRLSKPPRKSKAKA
jgi:hypothetical protein